MLTEPQFLDCAGVAQSKDCISARPTKTFYRRGSNTTLATARATTVSSVPIAVRPLPLAPIVAAPIFASVVAA